MLSLIPQLKQKLANTLPGINAQYEMAPSSRQKIDLNAIDISAYKKSAVMLLLYPYQNTFCIPLIKRHVYSGTHSGQISLPGGKFEEGDYSLKETALRELEEEIGISEPIEVIGKLTPLIIPVSNFYVEPYIGIYTHTNVDFKLNAREVKELITLDIDVLKQDATVTKEGLVEGDGYQLKTPYFNVRGEIIWGATAMILNEFKKMII